MDGSFPANIDVQVWITLTIFWFEIIAPRTDVDIELICSGKSDSWSEGYSSSRSDEISRRSHGTYCRWRIGRWCWWWSRRCHCLSRRYDDLCCISCGYLSLRDHYLSRSYCFGFWNYYGLSFRNDPCFWGCGNEARRSKCLRRERNQSSHDDERAEIFYHKKYDEKIKIEQKYTTNYRVFRVYANSF